MCKKYFKKQRTAYIKTANFILTQYILVSITCFWLLTKALKNMLILLKYVSINRSNIKYVLIGYYIKK